MNDQFESINEYHKIEKVKVAILADEPFFWGSRKFYHHIILNNYTWNVENIIYKISSEFIYDKDIIKGKLNKSNFDVLLIPGGGVGNNQAIMKGFNWLWSVKKFKKNISEFVKEGGGIIGICGGAALITNLKKDPGEKPKTFVEKQYNKSSLNISAVSSYFKNLAFPIFYPFQYQHPENIGNSAYAFSFAPGKTIDEKLIFTTGCTLEIRFNRDNPIFSVLEKETNYIRWWAGQAFQIPKDTKRKIYVLAKYPSYDVSEKDSTKIYAWRYTGGIYGLIKAFFKALKIIKKNDLSLNKLPIFTYYQMGNWEKTDKIINLNLANKACITAEIYPNEKGGRILLSSVHPEYMIWSGGHIEEQNSYEFNCIGMGFHKWIKINKPSKNWHEELTHNWWILRRFVGWVAKIPDEHLPPKSKVKVDKSTEDLINNNIFWDKTLISRLKSI
jgi:hypothetical protein